MAGPKVIGCDAEGLPVRAPEHRRRVRFPRQPRQPYPRSLPRRCAMAIAAVDGATTPERAEPCDVCGGPTFELHCKVICRRCGYTRDCGDP